MEGGGNATTAGKIVVFHNLALGIHCAVLEILLFNPSSYCTSQLFTIEGQSSVQFSHHTM